MPANGNQRGEVVELVLSRVSLESGFSVSLCRGDRVLAKGPFGLTDELAGASEDLRCSPGAEAEGIAVGTKLWEALPVEVQRELTQVARAGNARLVVCTDDVPEADDLPWEAMGSGTLRPVLSEHLQLRRRPGPIVEAAGALAAPDRMLVLIGSVGQEDGARNALHDVSETIRNIDEALRDRPIRPRIVAGQGAAAVLQSSGRTAVTIPGDPEQLREILGDGGGYPIVLFVGHSDAPCQDRPGGATSLEFEFEGGPDLVAIETLAEMLSGTTTRLVVLMACDTTGNMARALLPCVEHVVSTATLVDPELCAIWAGALLDALLRPCSVGEAARRARREMLGHARFRHQAWIPQHWSCRADDEPFLDGDRLLLARYCRMVEARHRQLHGEFEDVLHADTLGVVHVPLRMRRTAGVPGWELLPDEPFRLGELVAIGGAWVVRGEPGAGKTTSLRHVARGLAERRGPYPLYASLPASDPELTPFESIEGDFRVRGLASALERCAQRGELVLLLDGLDEVQPNRRELVRDRLRDLAADWPDLPILVTTRAIGHVYLGAPYGEVDVLPLDSEGKLALLENWYSLTMEPDEAAQRAAADLAKVEADASLRELSSVPLFLTLMAQLLRTGAREGRAVTLARTRAGLYDQFVDYLFGGKHQKNPRPFEHQPETRRVLAHVACRLTERMAADEAGGPSALRAQLESIVRSSEEWSALDPSAGGVGPWRGVAEFLADVALRVRVLGPHHPRDLRDPKGSWGFWHNGFREAFTAERLRAEPRERILERAEQIVERAERDDHAWAVWAEPFALLAAKLDDPSEFLSTLIHSRSTRPLGLRALANVDVAALDAMVLARLLCAIDRWEDRHAIYAPLVDGSPRRVLELLLPRVTPDADRRDLACIDWVLAELADPAGACRQEISAAREAILDALPEPADARALGEFPGRPGERLWVEVPPGGFRMGSPEDEPDRRSDETPVEVEISRAFGMAAVPVTNGQYALFDARYRERDPSTPATGMTWYEARLFCEWLSRVSDAVPAGRVARLPTEAEFEYACRKGRREGLRDTDWNRENSGSRIHPVAEKSANGLRLYDLRGNVSEWCGDWYAAELVGRTDPGGPATGSRRVKRSGSYLSSAEECRPAYRGLGDPAVGYDTLGFRVVVAHRPR